MERPVNPFGANLRDCGCVTVKQDLIMKVWDVCLKLNWDASRIRNVKVKANTERKARLFAQEKCKKDGAFSADVISCKQVDIPL